MKNEIDVLDNTPKMTTVEIAERTGKEHRNVLRDARKMLIQLYGKGGLLKFEQTYKDVQGKGCPCYALPKNETLTLVSGYSVPLRMKIIQRLDELEKQERQQIANQINQVSSTKTENKLEALKLDLFFTDHAIDKLQLSKSESVQLYCGVGEKYGLPTESFSSLVKKKYRALRTLAYLHEQHNLRFDETIHETFEALLIIKDMMGHASIDSNPPGSPQETVLLKGEGLKYGKNIIDPNSDDNKVVSLFFEDTFLELLNRIAPTWESVEVMGEDVSMPDIREG
jgi:Rha family phage regulatory protein